jgi:hypothetical protein
MIKFEFEADISKDGSVKIEFARPLSEDERKIMEVHGFRLSGTVGAWTLQSSGPRWGVEDLWELVNEFARTQWVSANGTDMSTPKGIAWVKQAKKIAEQMNKDGVSYVTAIPRKELPKGRVLVHNRVTPYPKIGTNGFRAWTQFKTNRLVQCHCDWAGVDLHGLPHYRVKD